MEVTVSHLARFAVTLPLSVGIVALVAWSLR